MPFRYLLFVFTVIRCEACPVATLCRARALEQRGLLADVSLYPAKPTKKSPAEHTYLVLVLSRSTQSVTPADEGSASNRKYNSEGSDTGGRKQYLMVQRPDSGLLAGQWEFPAAAVVTDEAVAEAGASDEEGIEGLGSEVGSPSSKRTNSKSNKGKSSSAKSGVGTSSNLIPNAEKLAAAAKSLIAELVNDLSTSSESSSNGDGRSNGSENGSESGNSAIPANLLALASYDPENPSKAKAAAEAAKLLQSEVHLFSHQRHTMHILPAELALPSSQARFESSITASSGTGDSMEGSTCNGSDTSTSASRCARWMNEAELAQVGVTTGMRKVLAKAAKPTKITPAPISQNVPKRKVSKYFEGTSPSK